MSCLCTVLAVKHPSGYYAACNDCRKKLRRVGSHGKSYSCRVCSLFYPNDDVPLRYNVILNVTDHESTCVDVAVFGESLNTIFGLPAEQFHSLLKEAYKLHTGSELELQDVAQFLHSVLESAFVGNCFDFRFSSVEGRVCLSDLLQLSGQRELQTLVTCGFKAPENHLSCTVVTILKCRFPVLQSLLPLPPSPIWPPTQSSSNVEGREDSSIFTLCSTPHDDGLSARSLVGLESISETIKDFSSPHSLDHSCGSTLDCSSFHLPSINLSSNHSDFTSTLSRDNCSTPSHMSAFLVFSQRAWNEFEHSLVHSPDPDSTSLQSAEPDPDSTSLQSAENIQVSGPSTFAKDESTPLFTNGSSPHFRHDTSPELFSEPHTQHRCVPQSGGHFVTPCVPKLLRRRILSHQDKGPTPSQGTSLNERNGHSPDLFTP